MSLGGHNQATKRKKKTTKTTPAGWIGTSTRAELNSTQQLMPVGLGHRHSRTTQLQRKSSFIESKQYSRDISFIEQHLCKMKTKEKLNKNEHLKDDDL